MNRNAKHAAKPSPIYKNPFIYIALILVACITVSCAAKPSDSASTPKNEPAQTTSSGSSAPMAESTPSGSDSSLPSSTPSSSDAQSTVSRPAHEIVDGTGNTFGYNTNLDIEDNVFMDALLYTGYNMKKHREDGNMWVYILSEYKRGLGYLSDITYGGGCTGLETNDQGLPDIEAFEQGGLVCASFATYVYFNYLPNVAGIDTSFLTKAERTYNADSFYTAAKDWLKNGHTYTIPFEVSRTDYNYIVFEPEEEIPIGSILVFEDDRKHDGRGSHITVYAGYKNGMHWVYQVGTSNGPEMCAVERMLFGPDPQWPLAVFATPPALFPNNESPTDIN